MKRSATANLYYVNPAYWSAPFTEAEMNHSIQKIQTSGPGLPEVFYWQIYNVEFLIVESLSLMTYSRGRRNDAQSPSKVTSGTAVSYLICI